MAGGEDDAMWLNDEGGKLFHEGKFQEARELFEGANEADTSNSPIFLSNLTLVHIKLEQSSQICDAIQQEKNRKQYEELDHKNSWPTTPDFEALPRQIAIRREQRAIRGTNHDEDGADEQEAQDIQTAMAESLRYISPPVAAGPIAGPSRPQPLATISETRRPLSPSVEYISPPAQRRRLLDGHTTLCLMQGPSIESLVKTLRGHIYSFFGEDPYLPADSRDALIITTPKGPTGLCSRHVNWCSGESTGEGVGKTVMDELINLIFQDETIWKKIGEEHVPEIFPSSLPLDSDRRCRLQSYGYICMLYMLYCRMLPQPLSALFACAVLLPEGDVQLLGDHTFLRLVAPMQMSALHHWPAKAEDFSKAKAGDVLHFLTGMYFDKEPSFFSNLGKDALKVYSDLVFRKVLFGLETQFKDTREIKIFSKALNRQLHVDSSVTFAQTVQELLDCILWVSTNTPSLLEFETRYKTAFYRYIQLPGIVKHPLLPVERLTDAERDIPDDHKLARALMFLITATGTVQLPPRDKIQMVFYEHLEEQTDTDTMDPAQNPDHWADNCSPVRVHTCFDGVDLPLRGVSTLLHQPQPTDATATDFDLYLYMMYRPITAFAEFGGLSLPVRLMPFIHRPLTLSLLV
ncbi:hypothetical protein B0H14DRAFT_3579194 [Mycena olivaceomarginata]|nr:hypothetical protein B0H14DRAFT_3579194 [Mycena olivaceomarginata]